MSKFFYVLTVLAFLVSATMAVAQDPAKAPADKGTPGKPGQAINCCVKGECKQVAGEADCTKLGGKVIKECKDCK